MKRENVLSKYAYERAPCDTCVNSRRCASELLACRAFVAFTHKGDKSREARNPSLRINPTRKLFKMLSDRSK